MARISGRGWPEGSRTGPVVAINAAEVRAIARARIKTDEVEARVLAPLLRAGFLPAVPMPSAEIWPLRQLVSRRRRIPKRQIAAAIRCRLDRRFLPLPPGRVPFAQRTRRETREAALPPAERLLRGNARDHLEPIEVRVARIDEQLLRPDRISESAKLLRTLPGIDLVVAVGWLAAIDDLQRLPTPHRRIPHQRGHHIAPPRWRAARP